MGYRPSQVPDLAANTSSRSCLVCGTKSFLVAHRMLEHTASQRVVVGEHGTRYPTLSPSLELLFLPRQYHAREAGCTAARGLNPDIMQFPISYLQHEPRDIPSRIRQTPEITHGKEILHCCSFSDSRRGRHPCCLGRLEEPMEAKPFSQCTCRRRSGRKADRRGNSTLVGDWWKENTMSERNRLRYLLASR